MPLLTAEIETTRWPLSPRTKALRTILSAASAKSGRRVILEILE